ncbi:CBS domain-containing protein [Cucumibacter marinus]|uniref:CBS domain-containing protein n=1 Tax=Cucumibacter marinus TaxID=1121252 RepID=UPI0004166BEB|nr:CBS domain-containing protein [Cucumibacter marinus]
MTTNLIIENFMVREFATLPPDMEIGQAARFLVDRGYAGAPVVDESDALVGILTKKDCFKAALNAAYYAQWGGAVERYMTADPETLDPSLDIVSAAERFIASPYRMFPVMSETSLVGVISRSDLLRAFLSPS